MTVVRVRWGWLRVAVVDTRWPTEHGKSAQSITNICPWKSELTFQCSRSFFLKRIKTHLLIYHSQRTQSSSWQVSLTCFTHLQKKNKQTKNLSASSGYEWAKKCLCRHTITYSTPWISHYSQERKKKWNIQTLSTHARGYIKKKPPKKPSCNKW